MTATVLWCRWLAYKVLILVTGVRVPPEPSRLLLLNMGNKPTMTRMSTVLWCRWLAYKVLILVTGVRVPPEPHILLLLV